jgi:hypothetical protein
MAAAALALWQHIRTEAVPFRAPAAMLMLLLSAAQLYLARTVWTGRSSLPAFHRRWVFWMWLFAGSVASYIAGLFLGPDPSVGYVVAAAMFGWYTLLLWVAIRNPALLAYQSDGRLWRACRGAARGVLATAIAVAAAEGVLRLYARVAGDRLDITYVAKANVLPTGHEIRGRLVNSLGYWDDEFRHHARPGYFRVAVLGDRMVLSGTSESNCLAQVERAVPGLEIYNFGIPEASPREYAAQLTHEVAGYRPDLVLTFVSIGDDVTQQLPLPGAFDWRGLAIYQIGARNKRPGGVADCDPLVREIPSRDAFLRDTARRLSVCRTPIEGPMHQRWQETVGHLEEIVRHCQRQHIPVGLVLVPGEFQVNPQLCRSLCLQAGFEPSQLDLELPQRRLLHFADDRHVPVLDLLPHFRSADPPPYLRNQVEWDDAGNTLAAQALTQWLRGRYGTQIAANAQASVGGGR